MAGARSCGLCFQADVSKLKHMSSADGSDEMRKGTNLGRGSDAKIEPGSQIFFFLIDKKQRLLDFLGVRFHGRCIPLEHGAC